MNLKDFFKKQNNKSEDIGFSGEHVVEITNPFEGVDTTNYTESEYLPKSSIMDKRASKWANEMFEKGKLSPTQINDAVKLYKATIYAACYDNCKDVTAFNNHEITEEEFVWNIALRNLVENNDVSDKNSVEDEELFTLEGNKLRDRAERLREKYNL